MEPKVGACVEKKVGRARAAIVVRKTRARVSWLSRGLLSIWVHFMPGLGWVSSYSSQGMTADHSSQ